MAQKREKEETELKVPETLSLRSPPISAAPSNLSTTTDDRRSSDPKTADVSNVIVDFRLNSASSPETPDPKSADVSNVRPNSTSSPENPDLPRKRRADAIEPSENGTNTGFKRRVVNRCSGCNKKVGLIGFTCRCGEMFCSEHRYSDRHDCTYDYKAAGREAIARENPVVRAAKILKV